jgi:hypothetical protein
MRKIEFENEEKLQADIGRRLIEYNIHLTKSTNKSHFARLIWGEKTTSKQINAINQICNGKLWIRPSIFLDICKAFPNLNIHWLITGEGKMEISTQNTKSENIESKIAIDEIKEEISNYVMKNIKSQLPDLIKKEL